jgi:hypothetical protein
VLPGKDPNFCAEKTCILSAAPGGGHILSSSNSIHSQVKPENFLAMIEATKKLINLC